MSNRRTTIERRVTTRVPIRVRVEYTRLDDFLDDYTANVSVGGMFIQTDSPLDVGTRFRLRFRIPGRVKPVETYGMVRWVIPTDGGRGTPGMGILFDQLMPADERAVLRWLDEHE